MGGAALRVAGTTLHKCNLKSVGAVQRKSPRCVHTRSMYTLAPEGRTSTRLQRLMCTKIEVCTRVTGAGTPSQDMRCDSCETCATMCVVRIRADAVHIGDLWK